MNSLTKRLQEIKELAENATKGPWSYDMGENEIHSDSMQDNGGYPAHICEMLKPNGKANREFIIKSRELVPKLIEALELAIKQRDVATKDGASGDREFDYIVSELNKEIEKILGCDE